MPLDHAKRFLQQLPLLRSFSLRTEVELEGHHFAGMWKYENLFHLLSKTRRAEISKRPNKSLQHNILKGRRDN